MRVAAEANRNEMADATRRFEEEWEAVTEAMTALEETQMDLIRAPAELASREAEKQQLEERWRLEREAVLNKAQF